MGTPFLILSDDFVQDVEADADNPLFGDEEAHSVVDRVAEAASRTLTASAGSVPTKAPVVQRGRQAVSGDREGPP